MKLTHDQLRAMGYDPNQVGPVLRKAIEITHSAHQSDFDAHDHIQTGGKRSKGRIRQSSKPLLNKLEQEFFERLKRKWTSIFPQAMKFRLGNGIWYKPDFIVCPSLNITAYEVKGPHAFRGGFENLKVAAGLYPFIIWILVWKENGQWLEQQIFS